jgi:DNA-binding transcriptional LysR family regulator
MAAMGYGWTELPRWMHKRFGMEQLVELHAAGWPRMIPVDLAWSSRRRLGSAGAWLLKRLLRT